MLSEEQERFAAECQKLKEDYLRNKDARDKVIAPEASIVDCKENAAPVYDGIGNITEEPDALMPTTICHERAKPKINPFTRNAAVIADLFNIDKNGNIKGADVDKLVPYFKVNMPMKNIFFENEKRYELFWFDPGLGIYKCDAEHRVRVLMQDMFEGCASDYYKTSVLNGIKDSSDVQLHYTEVQDINPFGPWICLKNGLFNTDTYEFVPGFNKDIVCFHQWPVTYDPLAKCPEFSKWVHNVVGNENDERTLIQGIGYLLSRGYSIQQALLLINRGRGGKGTFIKALENLVGDDNRCAVPLQKLSDRFATYQLWGKRVNICGDMSSAELKDSSMFKMATGQDTISVEQKGCPMFPFTNEAKFILACNKMPETPDESDGFMARPVIVEFVHNFVEEGVEEKDYYKRLVTEEEKSGIFNLAIEGLKELREKGQFASTRNAESTRQRWRELSDPVAVFLDEQSGAVEFEDTREVVTANGERHYMEAPLTTTEDLFNACIMLCKKLNTTGPTKKQFLSILKNRHEMVPKRNFGVERLLVNEIDLKNPNCFEGVRLMANYLDEAKKMRNKPDRSKLNAYT